MKKIGKQIAGLVLACAMVLALVPITVTAQGGEGTITDFGAYERLLTVPQGTAEADLPLPGSLAATATATHPVPEPADGEPAP